VQHDPEAATRIQGEIDGLQAQLAAVADAVAMVD
jgi:hypothetical protein